MPVLDTKTRQQLDGVDYDTFMKHHQWAMHANLVYQFDFQTPSWVNSCTLRWNDAEDPDYQDELTIFQDAETPDEVPITCYWRGYGTNMFFEFQTVREALALYGGFCIAPVSDMIPRDVEVDAFLDALRSRGYIPDSEWDNLARMLRLEDEVKAEAI